MIGGYSSESDSELDVEPSCSKKVERTYVAKRRTITVESSVNISSRVIQNDNVEMEVSSNTETARLPRKAREHGKQWNYRSKRLNRKKINLTYLVKGICETRETCLDWLKGLGLIAKVTICPSCCKKMKFEAEVYAVDGYIWICREKECEVNPPKFSARFGRWFEHKDISIVELLLFIYLWIHGFSPSQIMSELNMSEAQHHEWDSTLSSICEALYKRVSDNPVSEDYGNDKVAKRLKGTVSEPGTTHQVAATTTSVDVKMDKVSAITMWQKNKTRDPFIEFLKDADSL